MEKLHYLTEEEEKAIKAGISWELIDAGVRELVRAANRVSGIVTVQSCAGHVTDNKDSWYIDSTRIVLRATKDRMLQILFDVLPSMGIQDIGMRYFSNGSFWVSLDTDPSEAWRLSELFHILGREGDSNA